ncbi:GNAT family N-acetyltransferase [Streptomyces sp. NPDC086766]|uniref:GNAT family N-acetyltransferase n=1 Tax=Streptomyces sp. NPDC086766 TaxID=3365754 RepID=UPI0037FC11E7
MHPDTVGQVTAIRPRTEADLPGAAAALVAVHAADGYPVEGVDAPQEWLSPAGILQAWVADKGGKIVGHAMISRPQGEDAVKMWLEQSHDTADHVAVGARLFVAPEARSEGLGERLIRAAFDYAQDHGLRVVLDVMAKDKAAIRLYERMGMQRIGTAKHTYGAGQEIDAVCFVSPTS